METTIEFLKRKLKNAGSDRWEAIASEAGVAKSLPRKLAYGDRANPGIQTVQPLIDYFNAIDRGQKSLPDPCVRANSAPPELTLVDRRERDLSIDFPDRRAPAAAGEA